LGRGFFVCLQIPLHLIRADEEMAHRFFMIRSAWVLCLAVGLLLWGRTCLRAADDVKNPLAGHLIECGTDKVVLFDEPASPNGRYATGWTIRPNRKEAKAVDWSKGNLNYFNANEFIDPYLFGDPEMVGAGEAPLVDAAKSAPSVSSGRGAPYELLDGVVDLRKKGFPAAAFQLALLAREESWLLRCGLEWPSCGDHQ